MVKSISEDFRLLFTTDALYGKPSIAGDSLRICVRELQVMKGHPLHTRSDTNLQILPPCHFVFEDVSSSVRILVPYLGDPTLGKFGKEYSEADGPFSARLDGKEYGFEGRMEHPAAWVRDWVVAAGSFTLVIL